MEKTEGIFLASILSAIAAALIILPNTPPKDDPCCRQHEVPTTEAPARKRISGIHTSPVEGPQPPSIHFVKHQGTTL